MQTGGRLKYGQSVRTCLSISGLFLTCCTFFFSLAELPSCLGGRLLLLLLGRGVSSTTGLKFRREDLPINAEGEKNKKSAKLTLN